MRHCIHSSRNQLWLFRGGNRDSARRRAVDMVRLITDNIGGITGGVKIAHLAECFGMECAPHNWGGVFDHAVHFLVGLAAPNYEWFEMTVPQGGGDRPYVSQPARLRDTG